MNQEPDVEVLWIVPKAWEEEQKIIAMRPVTVAHWRQIIDDGRMVVAMEPDSRIEGGPADGGYVVRVDGEDGLHYFALPPEALPALRGLIPADDYARLIERGLETEGEAGDGDA